MQADTTVDEIALAKLVARLARGVDRADRDIILSCYADDSFDDHGRFRGSGPEFAEFICGNTEFTARSSFLYHTLGQSLFDVTGDEAYGETYFTYYMQVEPDHLYQAIGRYVDYFVRVDGRWLVKYRRVVMEWDGQIPAVNAIPGGHARGTRDGSDPVYQRLTWPTT